MQRNPIAPVAGLQAERSRTVRQIIQKELHTTMYGGAEPSDILNSEARGAGRREGAVRPCLWRGGSSAPQCTQRRGDWLYLYAGEVDGKLGNGSDNLRRRDP